MKILVLTNKIPFPPKDGGSIATYNLAIGLADSNAQIKILSINTKKHYFNPQDIPQLIQEKLNINCVDVNTELSAFSAVKNLLFSNLPYNAVRFNNNDFRQALIKILQKEKYDIIQLEGLYLSFYLDTIKKYSNAKIAYRSHNIEHEIWQRSAENEKNFLKRTYLKIIGARLKNFEMEFMNSYDLLVPITSRDAEKLNNFGNSKPFFVAPTGINQNSFSNFSSEIEYPSIFHIGALDWFPNQEGIMWFIDNCWSEIRSQIPGLNFYIAGRNAPQWLINKLNKQGIVFLGEIDDAYSFISSKAVMIVPLLSGSGMRIKIVEGMALGKTIVSTSIGAEGIDCQDETNILIGNNPLDFVKKVKTCLVNRTFFDEIGKNALNFVTTNFNNNAIAEKLLSFYKENI